MQSQELQQRIEQHYKEDVRRGPVAVKLSDIPVSYEAITCDWLTQVLCRGNPQARVAEFKLGPVDDGTANRRRIDVFYEHADEVSGLPSSVFCKASHDLLHRLLLGMSGGAHAEVTFLNRVRPNLEIDSPPALFAAYDPESFCSMVVMRDISDDVEFCGHDTEISWGAACAQMDTLVGLHSRYLGSDDALRATNLIRWPEFFANVVRQGQQSSSAKGFLAAEHVIPRRLFLRKEDVWNATVRSVEHHRTLPQTVIHGDCHLKQWFKRASGGMGLTDWQCATIGNWSRDLSYVVTTSLSVDRRRAWEKELLWYYIDAMQSAGIDMPSMDHVWLLYRQNMMSALNWWTGTLVPAPGMPEMQPLSTTMAFIARLATAVDDLDSIDSCNQLV